MIDSKLLDSSVWLEYVVNGRYTELINSNEQFLLSILSLFEIKRKLIRRKYEKNDIRKVLEFVKRKSLLIEASIEICEKAAEISVTENIPMADSIIYTTALENNAIVYTLDRHFRNLKEAVVLD